MLHRAVSKLPEDVEQLTNRVIACALEVHTRLGAGFVEAVYRKAMCIELRHRGLAYAAEHRISITYRGELIHGHRIDLVVEDRLIVELKAVERLMSVHQAQLVSYLRSMTLRVGLLINFNTDHLRGQIRRVVV